MTEEEKIKRYCVYQERCSRDVQWKLREWNIPAEKTKKLLQQLKAEGFLNDERFSHAFVRGKFLHNHWGKIRISHELKSRGISENMIYDALDEIDDDQYAACLKNMILKKRNDIKLVKNLNIREKLINFALNKGYEFDFISGILKEMKI